MLVYLKEKRGCTQIEGFRIYGKYYSFGSFGSTDVPIEIYKKNKNILLDAPYTKEWLDKKFKSNFPIVNFTIQDIKHMSNKNLVIIAKAMDIKFTGNHKGICLQERNAIKKAIIYALNN